MQKDSFHFTIKDVLKTEVALALGCTEPVAIALSSAAAASLVPGKQIESIEVWVDPNIYKNGIAVLIPGSDDLRGLDVAGALGVFGGDPLLRLEVLQPITEDIARRAKRFVAEQKGRGPHRHRLQGALHPHARRARPPTGPSASSRACTTTSSR
ncbi:MAG: hypothetical protein MZV70_10470 [Desulfobacterales bacterium]|nr:hypothetical protein [Desulfobacterales bacterium]